MRKLVTLLGLVVALVVPTVALAATLETGKFGDLIDEGDKCPHGAAYHFVNNQTGGEQSQGTIVATFFMGYDDSTPPQPIYEDETEGASMILRNVQHFYVSSTGMLTGAETDLDGKLVLSGVECKKKD